MTVTYPIADLSLGNESLAFCLKLRAGCEVEYRRRHEALWPEMRQALLDAGVLYYKIYLEPESLLLFAYVLRRMHHSMDLLPEQKIWQDWQQYMSDILVQVDGLPLRLPLQRVFYLRCDVT
jgi:L-rhamnose mutarotase